MKSKGVLYSTGCKYAVGATVFLARHPEGAPRDRIARECGLAPCFLGIVLKSLAKRGIVSSSKGAKGGFRLAHAPSAIRLRDLVAALDGATPWHTGCAMQRAPCDPLAPCVLHEQWLEIRRRIERYLRRTTVAELARRSDRLVKARAFASAE